MLHLTRERQSAAQGLEERRSALRRAGTTTRPMHRADAAREATDAAERIASRRRSGRACRANDRAGMHVDVSRTKPPLRPAEQGARRRAAVVLRREAPHYSANLHLLD